VDNLDQRKQSGVSWCTLRDGIIAKDNTVVRVELAEQGYLLSGMDIKISLKNILSSQTCLSATKDLLSGTMLTQNY
jgi:hypothetical protein